MSHLLEFPNASSFPPGVSLPPYAIFGIYGSDITSSLPPRIPIKLVLHFAPALKAWVLPAPDPVNLPRTVARQSLRTDYVGVDIHAPINAVGLCWIILRMLQLSGRRLPKETFGLHPDLATSIAIHQTWLALDLPFEGLRGLHMHVYSQLVFTSPPVSMCAMSMLWDAFPADSRIIEAMGLNFIRGHVDTEYSASESLEIIAWFQAMPERYAFFKSLKCAMPEVPEPEVETITIPAADMKEKLTGHETVRKKSRKIAKAGPAKEIRERGATRQVSPQERKDRQTDDIEALRRRLRRTKSDDSLRSVDTAIWNPQTLEEGADEEEKEVPVNDDMDDKSNYSDGSISTELARTLESIRLRREARNARHRRTSSSPTHVLTAEALERHSGESPPVLKLHSSHHRRSSSTSTTGKEHGLSIADLRRRIQALKEKQNNLTLRPRETTAMLDDVDELKKGMAIVDVEE